MLRTRSIVLCFISTLLLAFPGLSWPWSGRVIGIADGDTITVLRDKEKVKIRLYGVDCPERYQPFSKKAKQFTAKMVHGKVVEVEPVDIDRYSRLVALLIVSQRLVNEELVKAGFAWVYTRYCDRPICERWKLLENEAREAKRGLGVEPHPIAPWEFRRQERKSVH